MASIFTKIVNGEIPCFKVAENKEYLAFLDINPLKEGHVLVIPKKEVDYIFKLEDSLLAGLMVFAKAVAKAVESVIKCERIGVAVIGLEVPHTHIHLIPINSVKDINFANPKLSIPNDRHQELANAISEAYLNQKSS